MWPDHPATQATQAIQAIRATQAQATQAMRKATGGTTPLWMLCFLRYASNGFHVVVSVIFAVVGLSEPRLFEIIVFDCLNIKRTCQQRPISI